MVPDRAESADATGDVAGTRGGARKAAAGWRLPARQKLANLLVIMKSTEIGVFETKTHLSEILRKVAAGERFVITRRGEAIAELRPLQPRERPLERGCAANPGYRMAEDFDEPLADLAEYS